MATKQYLRAQLGHQRDLMSDQYIMSASDSIVAKAKSIIDWENIKTVHCYLSSNLKKEVDTCSVIKHCIKMYPNLIAAAPLRNMNQSAALGETTSYATDKNGIPLPENNFKLLKNMRFDVIIVPVLGFDEQCFRLGYGRGYYDKFLAAQPQAVKIGLAYEKSKIIAGLPHEKHDVPLNIIVTEYNIYQRA